MSYRHGLEKQCVLPIQDLTGYLIAKSDKQFGSGEDIGIDF